MNEIVAMEGEAYYAIKDRVSHSYLKNIDRSPAHYRMMLEAPSESTEAQQLGTYLHALVLEPDTASKFIVVPDFGHQGKKENKLAKENWYASLPPNAQLASAKQKESAEAMKEAIMRHEAARKILDAVSDTEVTILFNRENVECKARLDAIAPSLRAVVDIKTTQDASPLEYFRSVYKWSYHTQGEFYLEAINIAQDAVEYAQFIHIAVESTFKQVAVYAFPPELLSYAERINTQRLERVYNCTLTNYWPSYPNTISELTVPAWAYQQMENGLV